jgi:hypothetical protein
MRLKNWIGKKRINIPILLWFAKAKQIRWVYPDSDAPTCKRRGSDFLQF